MDCPVVPTLWWRQSNRELYQMWLCMYGSLKCASNLRGAVCIAVALTCLVSTGCASELDEDGIVITRNEDLGIVQDPIDYIRAVAEPGHLVLEWWLDDEMTGRLSMRYLQGNELPSTAAYVSTAFEPSDMYRGELEIQDWGVDTLGIVSGRLSGSVSGRERFSFNDVVEVFWVDLSAEE